MSLKKPDFRNKLLQTMIFISGSIWLGSQMSKILSIYYFFQTDEFGRISLKSEINPESINIIAYQLVPVFSVSLISYSIFILLTFFYTIYIGKQLKKMGWLFISLSIVFLCLPFEVYLSLIDLKLIENTFYRLGDSKIILSLFEDRILSLSSFPIISIILHFFVIALIIFKPLDKRGKIEN